MRAKAHNPAQVRPGIALVETGRNSITGAISLSACPARRKKPSSRRLTFAKTLPLDIALFHIAAPYPGTPFFFEVVKEDWFRPGTRWEQVDMDKETVLDYPGLPAERLMYWQRRAFREWALRPGPAFTYLKMLFADTATFKTALDVGLQTLHWQTRGT